MTKNFDTDLTTRRAQRIADRDFVIGGLPFRLRASADVSPDALEEWRVIWDQMLEPDAPPIADPDFLHGFYDFMENVLEPGQFEHFEPLTKPGGTGDPITIPDAVDLVIWATGIVAARPIGASSASSNGSTAPTTAQDASSSTEASSSPVPAGSTD